MDHAEEVTSGFGAEDQDVDGSLEKLRGEGWLRDKLVYIALSLDVALVIALIYVAQSLSVRLEQTTAQLSRQTAATEKLATQATELAKANAALEAEVSGLRQFVSNETAEEVLFLKVLVTKPSVDRDVARDVARLVHKYAQAYAQDPDLILAMIAVESNFDPNAVSHMGAVGLMQVMPQWKKVLGIKEDLNDPETSIRYGLQILGFYRNMYKDLEMALTAYNRGPGPVDAALMRGQDPRNQYAPRVMRTYNNLKSLAGRAS